MTEFRFPPIKLPRTGELRCKTRVSATRISGTIPSRNLTRQLLDPAILGPENVCVHPYEFLTANVNLSFHGTLYAPGIKNFQTCVTGNSYPLVVILHADNDFMPSDHLMYDLLGKHLASHGYIVASFARFAKSNKPFVTKNPNCWEPNKWCQLPEQEEWKLLIAQLSWLYNKSPIKNNLLDDMAVIGHSAGGWIALRNLSLLAQQKNILDTILLAPAFTYDTLPLAGNTPAFLGFNTTSDVDGAAGGLAWGQVPLKMVTCMGLFDHVPHAAMPRDVIFFGDCDHFFQDRLLVRAYVTAHLGLYVKKISAYRDIFKHKISPGSLLLQQQKLKEKIEYFAHLHGEASGKLRLVDFQVSTPAILTSGGISGATVDAAYKLNKWGTPITKVLWFKCANSPLPSTLRITWPAPISANLGFNWVSFRLCQVFDSNANISGSTKSIVVSIRTTAKVVKIGKLDIPFAYTNVFDIQMVKTVLPTHTLSLKELLTVLAPNEKLTGIVFDFSGNGSQTTIYMLGEVELWT